jgi:prophage regulatory protein
VSSHATLVYPLPRQIDVVLPLDDFSLTQTTMRALLVPRTTGHPPMSSNLQIAEELIEHLRSKILPPPSPMIRARELGELLGVSRTKAWQVSKSAGFPRPIQLGTRTRLWRRIEVERWLADHQLPAEKQSARWGPGAEETALKPRVPRGKIRIDRDEHSPTRRRASTRQR